VYVPARALVTIEELMNRSEQSYKEKSYPIQSTTLRDGLEMTKSLMGMKMMSWMTMRMMMREVSIWVMRRRLDLPRRKPRLVRIPMLGSAVDNYHTIK
jgi:hypothetical protein